MNTPPSHPPSSLISRPVAMLTLFLRSRRELTTIMLGDSRPLRNLLNLLKAGILL